KTGLKYKRGYYAFRKLDIEFLPLEKKDYIKAIKLMLLQQTADIQKQRQQYKETRQYLGSLGGKKRKCDAPKCGFLGVRKVAELVGYKSPATGLKYREMLFKVIKSPRRLVRASGQEYMHWSDRGVVAEFLYPCDQISF